MASQIYNEFKFKLGTVDWENDTIKIALVSNAYTPDIDAHSNYDDITNELPSGDGYTIGGMALINKSITRDDINDWASYNADDATWELSTLTARGAIVYKDTGTPATSTLISYIDFLADKSSSLGDFTIQWHADGVFRLA